MKINSQLISKLENLSMLKLSDSEKDFFAQELERMVKMIDKLSELDTKEVIPCIHINGHEQKLTADIVDHMISKDEALSNAKQTIDNYFTVPKVIK